MSGVMTGACVMGSVCVMSGVMGGVQCVCVMGGVCVMGDVMGGVCVCVCVCVTVCVCVMIPYHPDTA